MQLKLLDLQWNLDQYIIHTAPHKIKITLNTVLCLHVFTH